MLHGKLVLTASRYGLLPIKQSSPFESYTQYLLATRNISRNNSYSRKKPYVTAVIPKDCSPTVHKSQ